MKNKYYFIIALSFVILSSFTLPILKRSDKALHFIYIENSRDKTKQSQGISDEMFNQMQKNVEQIGNTPNTLIGLFISNDKPTFTNDITRAKSEVKNVDYTLFPNSLKDNTDLNTKLFYVDYSEVKAITVDFFVTEDYLVKEVISTNGGVFVNSLPKKLALLTNCDESKVVVNIYYPAAAKSLNKAMVTQFFKFSNGMKNFNNKVTYNILPL